MKDHDLNDLGYVANVFNHVLEWICAMIVNQKDTISNMTLDLKYIKKIMNWRSHLTL
ncbi:hypothetical protein C1645_789690, partial [Glomus cerebriforme]